MVSNLACVGLAVDDVEEFHRLVTSCLRRGEVVGIADGVAVLRWEDPSGARLVASVADGQLLDVLPSFAGRPGARLADVEVLNDEVALADVVDEDGEQLTICTVELEERRFLGTGDDGPVPAVLVALGVDVTVHPDEKAFARSDASLLGDSDGAGDQDDEDAGTGLRMGAESFISHGVYAEEDEAEAFARLNGTVLAVEERRTEATGQGFVVVRVRTAGFEVDLCLPADTLDTLPVPGNVVGGTVLLVGSMAGQTAGPDPGPDSGQDSGQDSDAT